MNTGHKQGEDSTEAMIAGVLESLERVQEFVDFVIPDDTNGSQLLREARATVAELIEAIENYKRGRACGFARSQGFEGFEGFEIPEFLRVVGAISRAKGGTEHGG